MNLSPQQATGKAQRSTRAADARSRAAVGQGGPSSNTGRKSEQGTAHVDWLGLTFSWPESLSYPQAKGQGMASHEKELLKDLLFDLFGVTEVTESGGGWSGYLHRWNIGPRGAHGLVAFGGAAQNRTINIQLSGAGCATVKDWQRIRSWGRGEIQLGNVAATGQRITRLDLAHDDVEGETVTVAKAREWYAQGLFTLGGRPPKASLIDDLDSGDGKTFYVGARENGKLCRVYEKGRELGDKSSEWVRVEVEFRGKDRWIDWDALIHPAQFLAAAYPCLDWISAVKRVVDTVRRAADITIDRIKRWLRTQAGPALFAMEQIHGGVSAELWQELRRAQWPARLQRYDDMGLDLRGLQA